MDAYLEVNTAKKRTHSLFRQGAYWYGAIPIIRDDWLDNLMKAFDAIGVRACDLRRGLRADLRGCLRAASTHGQSPASATQPAGFALGGKRGMLELMAFASSKRPRARRGVQVGVGAACLVGLATMEACRAPTEITLELSTDVKCADLRGTAITIGDLTGLDAKPSTTVTLACNPQTGRIGSMVVVPRGSKDDTVAMKVVTGVGRDTGECLPPAYGPGCIVARRALRFIASASLTLPIFMGAVCNGIACNTTETCVKGSCVDATIDDPSQCEAPGGCGESVLADGRVVDGGVVVEASSDARSADPVLPPDCSNPKKVWRADFDVDPTTQNLNADNETDWKERNDKPLVGINNGVWTSAPDLVLDTNPSYTFNTRTYASVTMRALEPGPPGATFWINADLDDANNTFAPIFVSVELASGGGAQTATLKTKSDPYVERVLATYPDLTTGMVTIELYVKPETNSVSVNVQGTGWKDLSYTPITPIGGNNGDRFATLVAWGVRAEFEKAYVVACE